MPRWWGRTPPRHRAAKLRKNFSGGGEVANFDKGPLGPVAGPQRSNVA